jgi:hypothetical protein
MLPPGFGERRDESGDDRVRLVVVRHDRDGRRRLLGRLDGDVPDRMNYVDLFAHQPLRELDNINLVRRMLETRRPEDAANAA